MSASKGHTLSMITYASFLLKTALNDSSKEKALQIFKKAADTGDLKSIFYYGKILDLEKASWYDLKKSLRLLRIAANNGNDEAMNLLAFTIHNGDGIIADFEEAEKYYKMAIEHGNAIAMNNYAYMLEKGHRSSEILQNGN